MVGQFSAVSQHHSGILQPASNSIQVSQTILKYFEFVGGRGG